MKSGKVWGQTEELLVTPLIEIHRIHITPNMVCSMHKHEYKWNLFYVVMGTLAIDVEKNSYDLVDTTILHAGDWTSVRPNEFHRFRSLDADVEALEVYYLEPLTSDIIRKNVGGVARSLSQTAVDNAQIIMENTIKFDDIAGAMDLKGSRYWDLEGQYPMFDANGCKLPRPPKEKT